MPTLYDNLNEDSASTFSSVFSSNSSSFRSSDYDEVEQGLEDDLVYRESSPPLPPSVAEANALFEHNLNAPVDRPKRVQARRVSFAEAREPSLNHDVEEISSLTHSAADTTLLVENTAASPTAERRAHDETEVCRSPAQPLLITASTTSSLSHPAKPTSSDGCMAPLDAGVMEQVAINEARALSVKSSATLLSTKTLAEYRHLKYVLRQRLLRRYYDLWRHWAQPLSAVPRTSHAHRCASVSTQTHHTEPAPLSNLSSSRQADLTRTCGAQDGNETDLNWNADVESVETVSVAGSSLGRHPLSRSSSPAEGRRGFSFPAPLPEPECLGATSRPSRLLDYGRRSDHPRPKGPQSLSHPSTGLPSVVEAPLRVVRIG